MAMRDTPAIELTTRIEMAPGIPAARAAKLRALGLTNVGRLVAHLPFRHEREEAEVAIGELEEGVVASARGEVTATRPVYAGRRPRFEAVLIDNTGRLDLVWFNQMWRRGQIHPGVRLLVQGQVRRVGSKVQMANPRSWVLDDQKGDPERREPRLRPVYPAGEGLKPWEVEAAVRSVLAHALPLIDDHLPEGYRRERALPELREAYRMMHEPLDEREVEHARRRLAFDELLLLQLAVFMKRAELRETLRAPALRFDERVDAHIRERFPFELTDAQERVIREIVGDVTTERPTNRLVQGDVGSGKTVVALYAMLLAVAGGHQAALLAPTEILAEQHFANVSATLKGSDVRVALLTGTTPDAERERTLRALESGETHIVVGTHALLTGRVAFKSLGVAIIDEQHRFGVHQRAALRTKGERGEKDVTPHVLVMTATPIPRTLAITLFGDLDVSTIDELPKGRTPIRTTLATGDARGRVYEAVRRRLEGGEQAYIVVPTIEGAELGEKTLTGVRDLLGELEAGPLAGRRLAALHGRLKRATREHIMARFRGGRIDALVATTVIEVGVDVPNATVMVIEHAERFGLAQLHQLRGRVGRGDKPSDCFLIADATTEESQARLGAIAETTDGFVLAEKDLELRGPGEVFGTRQAGVAPFRVADIVRDRELLALARRDAEAWIARSPKLEGDDEALLLRRTRKVHGEFFGLGDVG